MKCPKCGAETEIVTVQDVEVDRCLGCRGVWVDVGELESIEAKGLARKIDAGDAATGMQYDKTDRIACPKCGGAGNLIRMVAADQPHLWFEHCGVCHGAWFDAGELTDLSEHTLSDFIRDLQAEERR